jgi:hypothetical protein
VNTVHAQHERHLGAASKAPHTQFLLDLAEAIQAPQAVGDILILGIDANKDVRSRRIRQWANELNLHNFIFTRHSHLSPPVTCHRNDNRVPIDALFSSTGIMAVAAGFLKYGDGTPSDRRVLSGHSLDKSIGHRETIRLFNYDVSKTVTASEISTMMGKLFRSFLGQIGRFWSFVPISEWFPPNTCPSIKQDCYFSA